MQPDEDEVTRSSRTAIFPVLLSGGSGSRLWPLSRGGRPKQLLQLIEERTLLQQTALRALDDTLFEPLTLIAGEEHRFLIAEQLREIGAADSAIVLEPAPRNTAAAAAVAALLVDELRPDGLMMLMPADHFIGNVKAFYQSVRTAAEAAQDGYLVLFGVKPDSAATGYGYIRVGGPVTAAETVRRVAAFVEKPDRKTAETYLQTGEYLWNSGIFLFPTRQLLAEFRIHEPDLLESAHQALRGASRDEDFVRLEPQAFTRCRSISIDRAIMERTDKAAVVPAEFKWMDVGSWSALWSLAEQDEAATAAVGNVLAIATSNSYVRSEGPLVITLGVENLIVVATNDAVLVAHKERDQDVREIVDRLRRENPRLV